VTREEVIHLAEIVETFHQTSTRDEATLTAGGPDAKIAAILGNFEATESLAATVFPGALVSRPGTPGSPRRGNLGRSCNDAWKKAGLSMATEISTRATFS